MKRVALTAFLLIGLTGAHQSPEPWSALYQEYRAQLRHGPNEYMGDRLTPRSLLLRSIDPARSFDEAVECIESRMGLPALAARLLLQGVVLGAHAARRNESDGASAQGELARADELYREAFRQAPNNDALIEQIAAFYHEEGSELTDFPALCWTGFGALLPRCGSCLASAEWPARTSSAGSS
jgi:hypothetical protein